MGFKSILKGIWKGLRPAIEIGSMFVPAVSLLDKAIDAVEDAHEASAGQDKHAKVVAISDAALGALPITDAQKKELTEARDKAIAAAVAQRNATVLMKDAYQEFQDVLESFQTSSD